VAIAHDPRPRDLFASPAGVFWLAGDGIHRIDAATGRMTTIPAPGMIRTADVHEVFGSDSVMGLWACDLASGKSHLVSPANAWDVTAGRVESRGLMTLYSARYALDADFVYVAWAPDPSKAAYCHAGPHCRGVDLGMLSRVKRDGKSPPEPVGPGPDQDMLVADGYAYWGVPYDGIKRRPLALGGASERVWASTNGYAWPLGVAGGRLYFSTVDMGPPRTFALESVALDAAMPDGGAQARMEIASLQMAFADGILDGHCLYMGTSRGVSRADIDDGKVQLLIEGPAPPRNVFDGSVMSYERFLATDGRYLYWADYLGDRIVRWSR
jgi:hypothetical protein